MANQNSLFNKYSRYVGGGTSEVAENRIEWWERFIFTFDPTDTNYVIEQTFAGRPDLIATAFYGESRWWWVIAQINNILDPFTELVEGRTIRIPSRDRLDLMLSTLQGGTPSTREQVNTISPIIL